MSRHPATMGLLRWLEANPNLPAGLAAEVASECEAFADRLLGLPLPDGPELSAGLRKLLEAKDCFVRAAR